jgi:hypothetical protein
MRAGQFAASAPAFSFRALEQTPGRTECTVFARGGHGGRRRAMDFRKPPYDCRKNVLPVRGEGVITTP